MQQLFSLLLALVLTLGLTVPTLAAEPVNETVAPSNMVRVDDTVYIADSYNRCVWTWRDGNFTVLTGRTDVLDLWGQPVGGYNDGALSEAAFSESWAIVPYLDGFLVSDTGNHRVVAISDGRATLVAGAELTGDAIYGGAYLNDVPEKACFSTPQGVAVDEDGTVYVADTGNGAVRVVQDGFVSTLLRMDSSTTYPVSPRSLLLDGDTLYVGDVFSRVLLTVSAQAPDYSYQDVAEGAWYAPAVRFAAANELLQGTGNGAFSPEAPMSRAMIWTVLARYDGVDTAGGETWYAAGQDWAVETGVSDGSNPQAAITREHLATMLYRYAQSHGQGFTGTWMFPLDYADADQISDYAYEALCWMTMHGILNGVGENRINPQGTATRAEVAAVLMRYCETLISAAS